MSLLSRKPTPERWIVADLRSKSKHLLPEVIVPISDASVEIRIGTNGAYAFGSRELYRMSDSAGLR
jgi:hypothetical protein